MTILQSLEYQIYTRNIEVALLKDIIYFKESILL